MVTSFQEPSPQSISCWATTHQYERTRGFLKRYVLYKSTFYLLTYLLTMRNKLTTWYKAATSVHTHIYTLSFRLTYTKGINVGPFLPNCFRLGKSPKVKLGNCYSRTFTGRMPFLSPNQQHQSTEGWQCSWLGTACCHHAAMMAQESFNGCVGCLVIWLQGSIRAVTITVAEFMFRLEKRLTL